MEVKDLMNLKVSYFSSLYEEKGRRITLKKAIDMIVDDSYSEIIELHRKKKDTDSNYDGYHKKQVPKILFEGIFKKRTQKDLVSLNGLVLIDFDKVNPTKVDRFKEIIIYYTNPFIVFKSISNSLKALYYTDLLDKQYCEYGYKELIKNIDNIIKLRCSAEDIPYKLDYVAYGIGTYLTKDKNIYITKTPFVIPLTKLAIKKHEEEQEMIKNIKNNITSKSNLQSDLEKIEMLYKNCENENKIITESYEDWQKVGIILHTNFDYDTANYYFHKFSSLSTKYKVQETDKESIKIGKSVEKGLLKKYTNINAIEKMINNYS
jgi:hypothetical protein